MVRKTFMPPSISRIYLVGVGGTGGYLAQGLAKMVAGYKLDTRVTLIDPDCVEPKNCARQNFMYYEVGLSKAESLAMRLNQQYGTQFEFICDYGEEALKTCYGGLVITCVDTVKARKHYKDKGLWLDMGNGETTGQALFGNNSDKKMLNHVKTVWDKDASVNVLPNPFVVGKMNRLKEDKAIASCADQPFTEQGVFVNEWAAQAGLTILFQLLIKMQVSTPQIYFNTATGRMNPVYITKEIY